MGLTIEDTKISKLETGGFKAERSDKGVNELEDRSRLNYAERVKCKMKKIM